MKIILTLAAVVAAATSMPALAAPFSGPYIGAQVGSDNYNIKVTGTGGTSFDGIAATGVEGGVFAGFDVPLGSSLFIGAEASALWSGADATVTMGGTALEAKTHTTYGASGRLGVKLGEHTALYGRAGWSDSHFKLYENGVEAYSAHKSGLLVGGGLEHYLSHHSSLRVEYGYTMYGTIDTSPSQSVQVNNQQVSIGYGYHF